MTLTTTVGPISVDRLSRKVTLRGQDVPVSPKEFDLVRLLAMEPTRVFTKEELIRDVWGFRLLVSTRTLDTLIERLREKLSADGDRLIVNVWGVGYRLHD